MTEYSDEKIAANRRAANETLSIITGIDRECDYIPGRVTLTEATAAARPVGSLEKEWWIVAWKIDDPMWRIYSEGRSHLDGDEDAKPGIHAFHPDSYSWSWGLANFDNIAEAMRLRDRILRLTDEFGITLDSETAVLGEKS